MPSYVILHAVWQPAALESLAIDQIAEWIVAQGLQAIPPYMVIFERDAAAADVFLSQIVETIRTHLRRNLHPKFYNNLAKDLLSKIRNRRDEVKLFKIKPGSRVSNEYEAFKRMIETVFTEHLTRLVLETVFLFASFPSKAHLLTGLTHLKICLTCTGATIEDDIIRFLKELHCLKSLDLYYDSDSCCRSNVIKCIADNCEFVELLSLSYMRYINHKSMDMMIRLRHLKKVGLFYTEVTEKEIETLLLACENIEKISLAPDGDTDLLASALQRIASSKKNKSKRFNLKFYENAHQTSRSQLELIVKMCPLIQKIILTNYIDSQTSFVKVVVDLQDLREIELREFGFYADGVKDLLNKRGFHITQLGLENVTGMDMNALICISNSSPNLQDLCLWTCKFVQKPTEKPTKLIRSSPFGNLKKISMMSNHEPSVDLTDDHIEFLLAGCPNIESIRVQNLRRITKCLWLKILDQNQLQYLKEITLDAFETSKLVLFRMLENCVYSPEVLMHHQDYHGNVTEEDRKRLQDHLAAKFSK